MATLFSATTAALDDCITLQAGTWTIDERTEFCNAHEQNEIGTGCCQGDNC